MTNTARSLSLQLRGKAPRRRVKRAAGVDAGAVGCLPGRDLGKTEAPVRSGHEHRVRVDIPFARPSALDVAVGDRDGRIVLNDDAVVRIGASRIALSPIGVSGAGSSKCAGNYDWNYNFFADTCP